MFSFKKYISFFIASIFVFSSFISQSDTINQLDENTGRKIGLWIVNGEMSKNKDYANDAVIEKGYYKNSRKDGKWIKYWPNGNIKSEMFYKRGRTFGNYITYFNNGNIEEQGSMKSGFLYGEYKMYWPNGQIRQSKTFADNGNTEGLVELFYDNGNKELSYNTENGKESGRATWFYENGDLKKESFYNEGVSSESKEYSRVNLPLNTSADNILDNGPKILGNFNISSMSDDYGKTYDENKNILMDGEFKSGRLFNGRHYIYDEFGLLKHIEEYRDGNFVGYGVVGKKDLF
jgi:antitoxin component YwqK of YwqJK toxin-antitoxin module